MQDIIIIIIIIQHLNWLCHIPAQKPPVPPFSHAPTPHSYPTFTFNSIFPKAWLYELVINLKGISVSVGVFLPGSHSDFASGEHSSPRLWTMCSGWSWLWPRTPNMILTRPISTLYSPSQGLWTMGLPKQWLSHSSQNELQNLCREQWSKDGHSLAGSDKQQTALAVPAVTSQQ